MFCSFRTIFQGHPRIALFLRARLERTNLHFLSRAKEVKKEKRRRRRRRRRKKSVWSIVISSSSFPVSPFPFVAPAIKISGEALEKRIKRIDNRELQQRRTETLARTAKKQPVRLAQKQLCTCITPFCIFLCRHCTTTT